ncbi:MAG: tetratricopeptide repeat protein [Phycisphaerales bacterium]|nr:tetratricopeptide repeat protein [Phycisphaerales bacterium]
MLKRRGAGEEALNVERELIAFLRAAADEPDASISTLHRVAATFLFTVNDELRDAPRAVELELEVNRRAEYRNPLFVRGLAQAYLRAGDTMRAVQAWEQSFALIVDDRSRAAQLSYAAWELLNVPPPESRDPAAALKFAQRANELTGYENPAYLTNLARAFALDGQTETAVDVWNKLIAILPDDRARANSLNGAAWTLLTGTPETIRNPAVALKLALRAAELSKSENPAILDTLALAYARTGDAAKAVDTQEKAISLLAGDASDRAEYITRLTEYEAAANDSIQSRMP